MTAITDVTDNIPACVVVEDVGVIADSEDVTIDVAGVMTIAVWLEVTVGDAMTIEGIADIVEVCFSGFNV